jgi:hypothetical protein
VSVIRRKHGALIGYLAADVSQLTINGTTHVTVSNGTMTCELSGPTLFIDRYDADFRVRNLGITKLLYHDQELGFLVDGPDIVRGGPTPVRDTPGSGRALALAAYPNPFNPTTSVQVSAAAASHVHVVVYDVTGRRVRVLWDAPLGVAARTLNWDGRNDAGVPSASGIYLLRASNGVETATLKLTLLK